MLILFLVYYKLLLFGVRVCACLCMYMLMHMGMYVPWRSYGGQRITCGSHFFPSTTWVQGLNSGHLAQWQYLHPLGPLAHPQNGIFKRMKQLSRGF